MKFLDKEKMISDLEVQVLELRLRSRSHKEVKAALQSLCGALERGRILVDKSILSEKMPALIFGQDVQVRRWAYKAIALLQDPGAHAEALFSRVVSADPDPENMTWAASALFAIAPADELRKLVEKKKLVMDDTLALAARLYAKTNNKELIRDPRRAIRIDSAEPLTLLWVCLLTGYSIEVPRLFPKDYTADVILPQLNTHDNPKVAEYSIWALCQNPSMGFEQLRVKSSDFSRQPANVRRWINRLITKRVDSIAADLVPRITGPRNMA